jgi:hypothetical protein
MNERHWINKNDVIYLSIYETGAHPVFDSKIRDRYAEEK